MLVYCTWCTWEQNAQNIQNWLKTVPGNIELGPPIAVTMLLFSQPGPSSRRDFSCTTNFSWDEKVADQKHPSWHPQGRDLRPSSTAWVDAKAQLRHWRRGWALALKRGFVLAHLPPDSSMWHSHSSHSSHFANASARGTYVLLHFEPLCRGCCCWCCHCCCCCCYGGSNVDIWYMIYSYGGNSGKLLSQPALGHLNIHCIR